LDCGRLAAATGGQGKSETFCENLMLDIRKLKEVNPETAE